MQLFGQTSDLYDEQSADDADEQTFRSERSNIPNSCDIPHKAGTQHALHQYRADTVHARRLHPIALCQRFSDEECRKQRHDVSRKIGWKSKDCRMLCDPSTETSADEIAKPQWNLAEGTNDDDRNDRNHAVLHRLQMTLLFQFLRDRKQPLLQKVLNCYHNSSHSLSLRYIMS